MDILTAKVMVANKYLNDILASGHEVHLKNIYEVYTPLMREQGAYLTITEDELKRLYPNRDPLEFIKIRGVA